MVGGNPKHDVYGFRYWNNPGSFAEYLDTGSLGKFEGFLAALWSASFTVVGPEYIGKYDKSPQDNANVLKQWLPQKLSDQEFSSRTLSRQYTGDLDSSSSEVSVLPTLRIQTNLFRRPLRRHRHTIQ